MGSIVNACCDYLHGVLNYDLLLITCKYHAANRKSLHISEHLPIHAMLPPLPPKPSGGDPLASPPPPEGETVQLSSVEINILVYLYLLESNFTHTAFTLLAESNLPATPLFQHFNPAYPTPSASTAAATAKAARASARQRDRDAEHAAPAFGSAAGRIERGELIRKLWKAVRWEEVERHVAENGVCFFLALLYHAYNECLQRMLTNTGTTLPAVPQPIPSPHPARMPPVLPLRRIQPAAPSSRRPPGIECATAKTATSVSAPLPACIFHQPFDKETGPFHGPSRNSKRKTTETGAHE